MQGIRATVGTIACVGISISAAWLAWPHSATAHCDTLDGPVVMDAKAALEAREIAPILKWVREEHEGELRAVFQRALTVRSMGSEAVALADTHLFETVVRLHRMGEGAPYTGLKPAGEVEPPVAAADRAVAEGSAAELAGEIGRAVENAINARFEHLNEAKKHKDDSVAAGREYVEAYVSFVHFVEGLHNSVTGAADHH